MRGDRHEYNVDSRRFAMNTGRVYGVAVIKGRLNGSIGAIFMAKHGGLWRVSGSRFMGGPLQVKFYAPLS